MDHGDLGGGWIGVFQLGSSGLVCLLLTCVSPVHIFEYLLESTRVLSHGEGESNFHMFYYMFAGLYEKQLKDNQLNSPDEHRWFQILA